MREHFAGQEESRMASPDPTGVIRGDAAGGNQAVQMQMRTHLLIPGVKHRQEADLSAAAVRIGGKGEQGLRSCSKQHAIHGARILQGQPTKAGAAV